MRSLALALTLAPLLLLAGRAPGATRARATGGYPWWNATCEFGVRGGPSCVNPKNPRDAYDWEWRGHGFDPRGYRYRNCTSFVAWKLARNGYRGPWPYPGNADQWDDYFRRIHVPVDHVPAAGAVAQTDREPLGHLAYVEAVGAAGRTVTISDYNRDGTGVYSRRVVPAGRFRYIHVRYRRGRASPGG